MQLKRGSKKRLHEIWKKVKTGEYHPGTVAEVVPTRSGELLIRVRYEEFCREAVPIRVNRLVFCGCWARAQQIAREW